MHPIPALFLSLWIFPRHLLSLKSSVRSLSARKSSNILLLFALVALAITHIAFPPRSTLIYWYFFPSSDDIDQNLFPPELNHSWLPYIKTKSTNFRFHLKFTYSFRRECALQTLSKPNLDNARALQPSFLPFTLSCLIVTLPEKTKGSCVTRYSSFFLCGPSIFSLLSDF